MSRVLPWICFQSALQQWSTWPKRYTCSRVNTDETSEFSYLSFHTNSSLACRSLPLKLHSSLFLSGVFHVSCRRETLSDSYWRYNTVRQVIFTLDFWDLIIFILYHWVPIITTFILTQDAVYDTAVYRCLALTFLCSLTALISVRLSAKRISRAPTYNVLSSLLRRREV